MIPASERQYYEEAQAASREREEQQLGWKPQPMSPEERVKRRQLNEQAAGIVLRAADLLDFLAENAQGRSYGRGSPTTTEAALLETGYRDCLKDIRDIAQWEIPDA